MGLYRGYIGVIMGIMEKKMETTIMGYIGVIMGIMENKMETTIVGFKVVSGFLRLGIKALVSELRVGGLIGEGGRV